MLSEETQQAKSICCRLRVLSWVAHLAGRRVGPKFYDMFLVFLGASCQYKVMCKSTQTSKKQAEQPHSFDKTSGSTQAHDCTPFITSLEPKHRFCICACHPCKRPCNCCETCMPLHVQGKCSYYILSPCLGGNRFRFTTTLHTLRPLQLVVFSYLWCNYCWPLLYVVKLSYQSHMH